MDKKNIIENAFMTELYDINLDKLNKYYKTNILPIITEKDKKILGKYTSSNYTNVNKYLIYNNPNYYSRDQLEDIILTKNTLQKYIRLSKNPVNNLVVYHAGTETLLNNCILTINNDLYLKPTSFISTTMDKNVTSIYTCFKSNKPIIIEFIIRDNYPALWMKPFSVYPSEDEILLEGNHLFKVLKIDDDKKEYNMKVLTQ